LEVSEACPGTSIAPKEESAHRRAKKAIKRITGVGNKYKAEEAINGPFCARVSEKKHSRTSDE
jgi:hypothetical protein